MLSLAPITPAIPERCSVCQIGPDGVTTPPCRRVAEVAEASEHGS
jgi:hypothetical protein